MALSTTRKAPLPKRVCENDGVKFTPKRSDARFCSDRCRVAKWNRDHPRLGVTSGDEAPPSS